MNIRNSIKIFLAILIAVIAVNEASAQVTRTDYFMETSHLRNRLNPALRPTQGYLIVPILPNVGLNVQTNSFNLHTLTFPNPNGDGRVTFMHPGITSADALAGLSRNNYLAANFNVRLFGLGWFRDDNFWNVDLGIRTHADANVPRPFFELLRNGFDQYEQITHDLTNLSATLQSFVELGVSHSRPFLDNNLMLGARVNLLGGIADFNLHAQRLSIQAGPYFWEAKSLVTLGASGPGLQIRPDEDGYLDGFDFNNFGLPGFGVGFDLGAEYHLGHLFPELSGLRVSLALNDMGFISWSRNHSARLHSTETEERIYPPNISQDDGLSLSDIFDDAFDRLRNAINLETGAPGGRTTALRMNMLLGVEYEFIPNRLSAGILYTNRFGNYFNLSEFTVSANGRPTSWLSTSLSYSFMHSHFNTFGFALHIAPPVGVNFFVASDYIIPHVNSGFFPTTSRGLNFQTGISIPLGGRNRRNRHEVAQLPHIPHIPHTPQVVEPAREVITQQPQVEVTYSNVEVVVRQEAIQAVSPTDASALRRYSVVVASLSTRLSAEALQARLQSDSHHVILAQNEQGMFRVIVGSFDDRASAVAQRNALNRQYTAHRSRADLMRIYGIPFDDLWILRRQ